jgi:hypothetical protein
MFALVAALSLSFASPSLPALDGPQQDNPDGGRRKKKKSGSDKEEECRPSLVVHLPPI